MTEVLTEDGFRARIEELRAQRGDVVAVSEIAEIVENLMHTLDGEISAMDIKLYKELDDLARYIHAAKQEIADLRPDQIQSDYIPTATDELDAIVEATEKATGTILDAAEALEGMVANLDEENGQKITDVVINIYEACNFQDITGQRITKIVATLKHIEAELDKLVVLFGDEFRQGGTAEPAKPKAPPAATPESPNLCGPQRPEQATTQAEIDELLAGFD